tara:strand:+ start:150796 stop:153264 length:2469 start_codon:yes stop_codon:yes gene_type:complete
MIDQKVTPPDQGGETVKMKTDCRSILTPVPANLQYSEFRSTTDPDVIRRGEDWIYIVKSLERPKEFLSKKQCPLIKLASFGNVRSKKKGFLRHESNMLDVCGIEADYDGEKVSIESAGLLLQTYGVEAFIYTSPSHTEERPRWRVLAPLSKTYPVSERRRFVGMLNNALNGILAGESFTDAQCFYYGRVRGSIYRTLHVRGEPIDINLVLEEQYPPSVVKEKPSPSEHSGPTVCIDELRERVGALNVQELNKYGPWLQVGMAIHFETGGTPEGLELWDGISSKTDYYDRTEIERKWESFGREGGPLCTITTLERFTGNVALSSEFDDVCPTEQERDHRRDEERAALDVKRREHQKRQNEVIGEGSYRLPIAEKITLDSALERFVFLSEGSQVADVFNPHYVLKLADWKNTYVASTKTVSQPDKLLATGATRKGQDKEVPVSELWHKSERRKTVTTRTFKAGGGLMLSDPDGKPAFNTWRPFTRTVEVRDLNTAGLSLFLDHIDFLFGQDAPRFLDWLAHIEQKPGVLPHTSWLHIARHFGLGRNWLASVLTRVWSGSVAANLDLVRMLKDGFNDRLSRKVLAIVDEIREGGRESQWEHSEKLKSTITEETRRINPKYGHATMEFNACRWLLFSNHLSAIPLENGDRRIEVVMSESEPKGVEYYARVYGALESPQFIAAVATFLGERDISGFNPGAHAHNTEAKQAATNASRTPVMEACQLLVDYWPADFIAAGDLFDVLTNGSGYGSLTAAHRRTMEQFDIYPWGRPVKIAGKATRVSVLRNRARWMESGTPEEIRKEIEKVKINGFDMNAYEYLLGLVADT